MLRKMIMVSIAVALLVVGGAFQAGQADEPKSSQEKGGGPTIVEAYAPEVLRPGDTWRVYLRAEDRNGTMKDIAAMLWQAGYGYYSTDFTRIQTADSKELAGSLYLSTPVDTTLMGDSFELTLLIRDSNGERSAPIKLPLRFDLVQKQETPQKWEAAAKHQLGAIMVNIESSARYNSRGSGPEKSW
jgi:hypothetical protein